MEAIIKLSIASLIPIAASFFFHKAEKKKWFSNLNYWTQQIILGIVFGIIAIIGTEWGIKYNGYVLNCRDAAPLVAGLAFGSPAGVLAGVIGGVERYLAVAWGAGAFTRIACSVSTVLAGCLAAFLRRFMFENKRPTWGMALGVGVIMETFHLTMVLITNIEDATKAVAVIDTCLGPMVIANGLSVTLSVLVVSILAGDFRGSRKNDTEVERGKEKPIFVTIQQWLFTVLIITFIVTMAFQIQLQNNMANNIANEEIATCLDEISQDIEDSSNAYMLQLTRQIAREVSYGSGYSLQKMADQYGFTEVNVINEDGIITESTYQGYIDYDMNSGEQSAAFVCLLSDANEYVQPYGPISTDKSKFRKYAGVALKDHKGFVQTGYDAVSFQKEVTSSIRAIATNRHIGESGGVIILDNNFRTISCTASLDSADLRKTDFSSIGEAENDGIVRRINILGSEYLTASRDVEGYYILAFNLYKDAMMSRSVSLYVSLFSMVLIFSVMFLLIYMLIKKIVVNQILRMAASLSAISSGNLEEVVDVRSNKEFSSLSDDINTTVNTLKKYIAEAAARIDKELEFAKSIQMSALPQSVSLDERYDIYAFMETAKEVGGDFYDFYMTKNNLLHFLIADVSGKGIPAAMFMMRSKSTLKSLAERGLSVDDVFTAGNEELCHENEAGMFVTAWQGTLDLDDGHVFFSNAGHNLPAVKKSGGNFELVKQKVNLVLGGMEGIPYKLSEMQLEKGDVLFLYTDGVTEATNAEDELFGEDRLLNALNKLDGKNLKEICEGVKQAIDDFVKEADQFDDITMVALEYKG